MRAAHAAFARPDAGPKTHGTAATAARPSGTIFSEIRTHLLQQAQDSLAQTRVGYAHECAQEPRAFLWRHDYANILGDRGERLRSFIRPSRLPSKHEGPPVLTSVLVDQGRRNDCDGRHTVIEVTTTPAASWPAQGGAAQPSGNAASTT